MLRPLHWYFSPAWWWRRWRGWRERPKIDETISLDGPSGEMRIVIPAGQHGAWQVYARGELMAEGTSPVILPQCLVEYAAPRARERGYIVAADELHAMGVELLAEQAAVA